MSSIFEPTPRFSKGVHKTLEVDSARLDATLKALDVARQLGEAAPIVSLIKAYAGVSLDAAQFFTAEDGYPASGNLAHYIPQILRAEGTHTFGLDLLGEIYAGNLQAGRELIDRSKPESPAWLHSDIELPFRYCPAAELLGAIDFSAGIDQEAVGAATEAFDMGELGDDISGVGDFQVDALDDWAARLRNALADFKFALEDIVARDGVVLTWYDRV